MADPWITAEGPNTTAIFFGMGAVCSLYLTDKSKHGYFYFIPTVFFVFMVLMTVCRGMIITIFLLLPVEFILIFRKTHNKKSYLYVLLCIITVLSLFELTFQIISDPFNIVYDKFRNSGTSGRTNGLYEWCISKFFEHPILGYGFLSNADELVPHIRDGSRYILAHNTILQYLVSVGIVGSIVALYFYIEKYRLYFHDFYGTLYLIFSALVIALSGMVDQAAMTDPFIFTTSILLLSAKEKDLESKGIAYAPLINFKKNSKSTEKPA